MSHLFFWGATSVQYCWSTNVARDFNKTRYAWTVNLDFFKNNFSNTKCRR